MDIFVDRTLPITIAAQLQGQIEYGVAFGSIAPGSKLPSVRDLAEKLDVSPVTVAHAYKALRERGILITRRGAGTYVDDRTVLSDQSAKRLLAIHRLIDQLLHTADTYGIGRMELKRLINLRLDPNTPGRARLKIVFVGNFLDATRVYVAELKPYLNPDDEIVGITLDQVHRSPDARALLAQADITIALAHRIPDVRSYLDLDARIAVLDFMPSEATRTALAELSPNVRVGLISTYAEFLGLLKRMVLSFAPHLNVVNAAVLGSPQVGNVANFSDVVVYTTGADEVLRDVPLHATLIEFRYTPDPRSIEQDLLPLLHTLRRNRQAEQEAELAPSVAVILTASDPDSTV